MQGEEKKAFAPADMKQKKIMGNKQVGVVIVDVSFESPCTLRDEATNGPCD